MTTNHKTKWREALIKQDALAALTTERDILAAALAEANKDAERLAEDSIIFGAAKECRYCHQWEMGLEPIKHTDDCPIALHNSRIKDVKGG